MRKDVKQAARAESDAHHYFSSDRKAARTFAVFAHRDQAALVRTIGVRSKFELVTDPRIASGNAVCTKDSIPQEFVLGSKHSEPGNNAEVFKDEMQKAGHYVSTEQAGRLLREVQSDSEDDMVR
jgi:type III effector protein AvrRpm1